MKNYFVVNEALFSIGQLSSAKSFIAEPGYNYDIMEYEGKKYLRQLDFNEWEEDTISTEAFSQNKNCVIDLIKLATFDNEIIWNNCSRFVNENQLLKWCYRYGLPHKIRQPERIFIKERPSVDYETLSVHVVLMKLLYNMWFGLINQDIDTIIKNILLIAGCPFLKTKTNEDEILIIINHLGFYKDESEIKDMVSIINNDLQKAKICCCCIFETLFNFVLRESSFFEISSPFLEDLNGSRPLLEIEPRCFLLDLCYYQLLGIINNKEGSTHLKECANPECKQLFWCHHKSQKYCPNCDRRTVWKKQKEKSRSPE